MSPTKETFKRFKVGNSLLMILAMKPGEAHMYLLQPRASASCLQALPLQETCERAKKMTELQNLMLAAWSWRHCITVGTLILG